MGGEKLPQCCEWHVNHWPSDTADDLCNGEGYALSSEAKIYGEEAAKNERERARCYRRKGRGK